MASLPAVDTSPRFALPMARAGWFVATIFVSALLLFTVQPMVARMALPRLGGAPAVWNSAMLVYQALLLAGYAYAHALGRLAPRRQAMVHIAALLLAAATLPLALKPWLPPETGSGYLWVPWLFLASIGPIFFVMSAHAPLLQRWFALSGHGDPYRLYAASNVGSFLGLAAYPLLVEPLVGVDNQSLAWSAAYLLLVPLVAGCALRLPRSAQSAKTSAATPIDRRRLFTWLVLAAVPSGLICSTTLHLTTDIVAMPLLWVMPLGLYLLSFSLAFAPARRGATWAARLAPVALLAWAVLTFAEAAPWPLASLALALTGLFLVSVALHARLYDQRPDPSRLTLFYLVMSAGGVLGGLFAALVAPLAFNWSYEHPLLLIAAAALLSTGGLRMVADGRHDRHLLIGALALTAIGFFVPRAPVELAVAGGLFLLGLFAIGRRAPFTIIVALLMLATGGAAKLALSADPGRLTRSYFGIYALLDGGTSRMLVHGTTSHGVQLLGSEARERTATAYYASLSGIGLALASRPHTARDIAVVGLGAGTLACYARPNERWRFYEIDPAIDRLARDRFSFLSRCTPDAPTVIGDARLTLAREPAADTDLLVIDAFSSDSVPMHLLTREALADYRRLLRPDGLLMIHISNRFLDLEPVLAAGTRDGWVGAARLYRPDEAAMRLQARPSLWVALAPDPSTIDALRSASPVGAWRPLQARPGMAAWTDGHSSILPLIRRP